MKYYFRSDKGKIREINEDAVSVLEDTDHILALVADGMGGHQAGDVASQLAIESVVRMWENKEPRVSNKESAEVWLQSAVSKANNTVYEQSQQEDKYKGMGTTIVAAICHQTFISVAHIGDSRAYLLDKEDYKQITADHSLVGELVRTGQLSEEDAQVHPRKNVILKALGTEKDVEPDVYSTTWEEGSKLLLCTDGLTNKIDDNELYQKLLQKGSQQLIDELIQLANQRGGEDNITLALIEQQEEVGDSEC
ncbi:Stp1/IreP family PP2C-type Ser/Thr phosphatase [Gracilibacillus dipsosauri]|uniref:protein-serine/threonine phosphatase n=1 Tax=Gracilibacillus dipsosauri TaxID=178340 RepID=A0A317L0Y0_9BACI|nr:Stp1/IreP family PP2C-type Ser/Thr phosphatase [Gracilibacillus dipsosauri]PWU68914.1 Stp1/IreP family PP2C-type Ser/Thr phosphatase [Gracilibacillus dipsosauri]